MEALSGLVVLVHALAGILFIVGLVGRWIVLGLAERADTLASMRVLTTASAPFERLVIVVSSVVLVLGIAAAIAVGRPFLGPLQGGHVDWLVVSLVLFVSNLPLVPLVFLPRGRVFEAALQEAIARDQLTPALMAAWRDPVVRFAHGYELTTVSIVLILMLTKPF
ncbi:MAG: DUF2269 family protein [Chloroflexota bacterium]|nr:MAG: DUF2269 family protein [Chloroflexota bacterium]